MPRESVRAGPAAGHRGTACSRRAPEPPALRVTPNRSAPRTPRAALPAGGRTPAGSARTRGGPATERCPAPTPDRLTSRPGTRREPLRAIQVGRVRRRLPCPRPPPGRRPGAGWLDRGRNRSYAYGTAGGRPLETVAS